MRNSTVAAAVFLTLLTLEGACTPAGSQRVTPSPESPAGDGDGGRCASIPPVGWRTDTLFGYVNIEPADSLLAGWDEMLLAGIREYFALPEGARVPVHGAVFHLYSSASRIDTVSLSIVGEASAELKRDGMLGAPKLGVSTLSPAIDESLLAAMHSLDSAGVIPPFPEMVEASSVSVRFTVTQAPDSSKRTKALAVLRQPMWLLERPVTASRDNPSPRYPPDEWADGIEGDVLLSFVVDQDGWARPETVRVVRARNRHFQRAVLDVLPRFRFRPASIDGCPVAQLVQMPFGFRIPR